MGKKKFKDTTVGKILIGASSLIPGVGPALADALNGSTTPLEALKVIQDSQATPAEKKSLQELLLKADADEAAEVTKRWQADAMSDSWLSKNVRPASLVLFSIAYVIGWFQGLPLDQVNGVMMLIFGGYFGARAVEKVNQIRK